MGDSLVYLCGEPEGNTRRLLLLYGEAPVGHIPCQILKGTPVGLGVAAIQRVAGDFPVLDLIGVGVGPDHELVWELPLHELFIGGVDRVSVFAGIEGGRGTDGNNGVIEEKNKENPEQDLSSLFGDFCNELFKARIDDFRPEQAQGTPETAV